MEFKHKSVLLQETIDNLNIRPDGIYVDGTLGGGGHSYEIASRLSSKGRLIGIDQDEAAIAAAGERLKPFADRVTIVRNNYCNMDMVLKDLGIERVDGILLDLGVSSYQLDTRFGFLYIYNSLCRGGRGFYTAVCTVWGFMAGGTGNFGGERDFD